MNCNFTLIFLQNIYTSDFTEKCVFGIAVISRKKCEFMKFPGKNDFTEKLQFYERKWEKKSFFDLSLGDFTEKISFFASWNNCLISLCFLNCEINFTIFFLFFQSSVASNRGLHNRNISEAYGKMWKLVVFHMVVIILIVWKCR